MHCLHPGDCKAWPFRVKVCPAENAMLSLDVDSWCGILPVDAASIHALPAHSQSSHGR